MHRQKEAAWREAKRRCRLTDEEVRMAQQLGFRPKSLIQNIPSRSEQWKAPVNEWVRSLYEEKIGSRNPGSTSPPRAKMAAIPAKGGERRCAEDPWPDNPEIPDLRPLDLEAEFEDEEFNPFEEREEPDEDDIDEQNGLMLRRQRLFRWAAQAIAVSWSELPEVQKVAAFGATSQPLDLVVPRFREFRRHRIEVLHECADLDLAVWLTEVNNLSSLKKAMARGLALTQNTPYGGVAHHQVDVHVFDNASGEYRGRLCIFGQCPKPGKRECRVPGCGAQPFLQQFERYHFKPTLFSGAAKVMLFDRAAGFLVSLPKIDAKLREVKWRGSQAGDAGITDDDLRF
jgi:hypothetical protein